MHARAPCDADPVITTAGTPVVPAILAGAAAGREHLHCWKCPAGVPPGQQTIAGMHGSVRPLTALLGTDLGGRIVHVHGYVAALGVWETDSKAEFGAAKR